MRPTEMAPTEMPPTEMAMEVATMIATRQDDSGELVFDTREPSVDEVVSVARGIAAAVSVDGTLTALQASLLRAITKALTDIEIDYGWLRPITPEELAAVLAQRGLDYRQRIVQHMVLSEMVLTPLPPEVADRVDTFARALGVDDDFVRIARRYADGALGLAWVDLRRAGFEDRWDETNLDPLHTRATFADQFDEPRVEPELAAKWAAMESLPEGTLGRGVWQMYQDRAFDFPGMATGAPPYLAQHDFVHVLADYGTTLEGELEVFSFIGRADPDPKGFAWIATMVGLFESGYVHQQGFFQVDVRERHAESPGMSARVADALKRGKQIEASLHTDLFRVDYHELAALPLAEAQARLCIPPKSPEAIDAGSVGLFDPEGLSEHQRQAAAARREQAAGG
jgi:hypothetical protein